MRALYEINADLEALLNQYDPETGEVMFDPEALDALLMEKQEKIEGVCLAVKNLTAEVNAIKAEEDALKKRREALEKKKDGYMGWLGVTLAGEKFETARCAVGYRKSEQTEITDAEKFWKWAKRHKDFIRQKDPEADKAKIKAAIKAGETVPGAEIVQKQTMSVK